MKAKITRHSRFSWYWEIPDSNSIMSPLDMGVCMFRRTAERAARRALARISRDNARNLPEYWIDL